MHFFRCSLVFLGVTLFAAVDAAESKNTLPEAIALLGKEFIVAPIPAPVLEDPAGWINRDDGDYHYLYIAGDDFGRKEQIETHRNDLSRPGRAWTRQIGESYVEAFEIEPAQGIRLYREVDRHHGFQVKIDPGVAIRPGAKVGDAWQTESRLAAQRLSAPEKDAFTGRLVANCRYVGAWRVRTPAGEFDSILIEQALDITVGQVKANDVRHLFYARGVGVVAEIEALRATALVVIRVREKSAKVLTKALPSPAAAP